MTAFMTHLAFEFKTGMRNATLVLMNYFFPLGFYAMMGLVMVKINPTFADTMTPAMVILAALASTVLGLPAPLVGARDAGIFRNYKINGVPALSILGIPTLTTALHTIIVAVIIAATATPLFGAKAPTDWGAFALVSLVTIAACAGLGTLIGVISDSARATVLWTQLLFLPSMLLGGLMLPLEILPESVRPISGLLPSTHAMQAYLGLAYGQPTLVAPWMSLGLLLATAALAFGLAIYLFSWDSHNSTRRGHPLMALLILVPLVVGALLLI